MIAVTYHHPGHGSTIVDGADEQRYTQLLADQGIEVIGITRALVCDDCRGLGVVGTPYCARRKAHQYHFPKCRKPCETCKGQGELPIESA